jgi:hypothetical protein
VKATAEAWNPITTFEFVQPDKRINMNDRLHWSARARTSRAWRNAAHIAAVGASRGRGPAARAAGPRDVVVRFDVTGVRRRDPHNWHPTVKAIVDGLVDAGLWPDDTPDHVHILEPVLTPVPVPRRGQPLQRLTCTVELLPKGTIS